MAKIQAVHSRFECKYMIEPRLCEEIRAFIKPFMQPDRYALRHPNYTYPISSLYLDSPDLQLYNQVLAGEKNRFKLRVRTYSDKPEDPVFFEVKKRMNLILSKRRALLDRAAAREMLIHDFPTLPAGMAQGLMPDLDEFTSCRLLIGAKPVLRVRYMREAYESKVQDPVRLTFDTKLFHAVTLDGELSHSDGEWVKTPLEGVILEMKFTDRFPSWMSDMAEFFQLTRCSVPKYVMSVDQVLSSPRTRVVTLGGFNLPPSQPQRVYRD
jgi:hypothetical protein